MTSQLCYFVCGPTLHQIGMVAKPHSYVAAWLEGIMGDVVNMRMRNVRYIKFLVKGV